MTVLPPTVSRPPSGAIAEIQTASGSYQGMLSRGWRRWVDEVMGRLGGPTGKPIVGQVAVFETTIGQAALASGGTVTLLDAESGERWKVRDIFLSGAGTNFSGGSGNRALSIGDGTTTWSIIPAATLQSLAAARWGATAVAFPVTAAHLTAASVAGADIVATYSGGSNDYAAGSCTVVLVCERVQ